MERGVLVQLPRHLPEAGKRRRRRRCSFLASALLYVAERRDLSRITLSLRLLIKRFSHSLLSGK